MIAKSSPTENVRKDVPLLLRRRKLPCGRMGHQTLWWRSLWWTYISAIVLNNTLNLNSKDMIPWSKVRPDVGIITSMTLYCSNHDDVIKWKHFPRYWPFVRGIHRSPVNSPHKGQWHGALMFSLICVWINGWVNSRAAGDLRRHRGHYDINVTG